MTREYCSKCQSLQNMNVSDFERIEKNENDHDIKIVTKNFQCSVCHSFIRSEETNNPMTSNG